MDFELILGQKIEIFQDFLRNFGDSLRFFRIFQDYYEFVTILWQKIEIFGIP